MSIAALFAALKSAHMAAVPVRRTVTPGADSRASGALSRAAASTISAGGWAARPVTITVRRSAAIVCRSRGASTSPTAGSRCSTARTRAIVGSSTSAPATTTDSAYAPRPGKLDSSA